MTVRVRFAPSPTGFMHLGNARTALFNYLFARHHGGQFLLRIEDTDRERSTEEAVAVIFESLKWLGLDWDEDVWFQSKRLDIYHEVAERMIADGLAYRCTCSREELEQKKQAMEAVAGRLCYDRSCRDKNHGPDCGEHVVRFKMPLSGETVLEDLVQGRIVKQFEELDDFVMIRTDGMPTYQFAVVVDDNALGITHVIRGSDHIDNTHEQIALYNALGMPLPQFAHAPRILGLSKRAGSPSVEHYRDTYGLTSEGLNNYIARLGWSHGDDEIFSPQELIDAFDIDGINKPNSQFDLDKLVWVNEQHLRLISLERLFDYVAPRYAAKGVEVKLDDWMRELLLLMRKRAHNLDEIVEGSLFIWQAPEGYEEKADKKHFKEAAAALLDALVVEIERVETWDLASIEAAFAACVEATGKKMGKIAQPCRVALTGTAQSPGIYDVVFFVGKEESVRRLKEASAYIANKYA